MRPRCWVTCELSTKLCGTLRVFSILRDFSNFLKIMAAYATYRHIELDKVGCSKKRVRNPSSEIFNVLCSPPSIESRGKSNGLTSPRRSFQNNDSFNRLFGSPDKSKTPPRRASLTNQDVKNRNPVTGNGVDSFDSKQSNRNKVYKERNPVTGEEYVIVSPAVTPTKPLQNGFAHMNANANGNEKLTNGN